MTFKEKSGPEETKNKMKAIDSLAGKPLEVERLAGRQLPLFPEQRRLNQELFFAAMTGRTDDMRQLVAKGADVNARSDDGTTALAVAASHGHTETARGLIGLGAEINARYNRGRTALLDSAAHDSTESVKMLIDLGADIVARDDEGRTALMHATKCGHAKTAEMLLASGAHISEGDYPSLNGLPMTVVYTCTAYHPNTAREWAGRIGNKEIEEILRKRAKELKKQNATK